MSNRTQWAESGTRTTVGGSGREEEKKRGKKEGRRGGHPMVSLQYNMYCTHTHIYIYISTHIKSDIHTASSHHPQSICSDGTHTIVRSLFFYSTTLFHVSCLLARKGKEGRKDTNNQSIAENKKLGEGRHITSRRKDPYCLGSARGQSHPRASMRQPGA